MWVVMLKWFGESTAAGVALALFSLTVLSAGVGFLLKSTGLYAALCLLFVSGGGIFFLAWDVGEKALALLFLIEGFLVGLGYAAVYILLSVRRKIAFRRAQRAQIKRRLQFTLPDRENSYLRDRLHTALQEKKEEIFLEKGIRIGYAKKMLAKVKEESLTPTERIDVEEMARLLALYEHKEKWSASDTKTMSEVFARLLKLSAKYEIAV